MLALKVTGVIAGAFALLMLGFIQPARNSPGLVGVITLIGVSVCGGAAFMAIRGLIRAERRTQQHD